MSSASTSIQKKSFIAVLIALGIVIFVISAWVSMPLGLGMTFVFTSMVLWQLVGKTERNLRRHQDNIFKQYECLKQLELYISPREPFPYTRGYRGSPDFLLEIYHTIIKHKPRSIVEASSGLSTLVSAYALKSVGDGAVLSLENDQFYADISEGNVKKHGLSDIAKVAYAPLINHDINGESWQWYDFESAGLPDEIDMIVVDGPHRRTQKNARYPALPLLISRLSRGGILLLDDADRPSEKATLARWQQEFPDMELQHIPLEKGMAFVKK